MKPYFRFFLDRLPAKHRQAVFPRLPVALFMVSFLPRLIRKRNRLRLFPSPGGGQVVSFARSLDETNGINSQILRTSDRPRGPTGNNMQAMTRREYSSDRR